MRRLTYLASAERDLLEVFEYLVRTTEGVETALRFVGELRGQCRRLAALPGTLGRPRPELRRDIRSFPFKGYIVFFRYREDEFEIVNILAAARDIASHFGDDAPEL